MKTIINYGWQVKSENIELLVELLKTEDIKRYNNIINWNNFVAGGYYYDDNGNGHKIIDMYDDEKIIIIE